jgi:hypothetical protein
VEKKRYINLDTGYMMEATFNEEGKMVACVGRTVDFEVVEFNCVVSEGKCYHLGFIVGQAEAAHMYELQEMI